ncbi:MAG: hypothetical protein LBL58_18015 [Tannerellaceae bacterium]|jgi:hypothetical protein|nr:hypothetical protein [Tannerellaceae bacterium]
MEDRKINEKESLELIAQMIRSTQNKLAKGSGRPFLLFGYTSVVFAIAIWFLLRITGVWQWNCLWFAIPLIFWPVAARIYKNMVADKTTYVDRIIRYIWVLTSFTIIIACGFTLIFIQMESLFFTALLLGMSTALTGLVVRIRPVTIAGIAGMVISPAALWLQDENRLLLFAVIFVLVFVVPGHILNYKSKTIG